jgi:hypothetical protein
MIAGEGLFVPVHPTCGIEHERDDGSREIGFKTKRAL